MRVKNLLFLFLIPMLSCTHNPYDTSTPEKFVTSLSIVGEQPKDHNPLPFFYNSEAAEAILYFDQAAEATLQSFDEFRNLMATKFPSYIKKNKEGEIKIALDSVQFMSTRSFTFSASMVAAQMKERSSSDYEFISATTADSEGIIQLKVKISGRVSTIPIKKTEDGFRMFLTEGVLKNLDQSVEKTKRMREVFLSGINQLNSEEITAENFKEKIEYLYDSYMKAVR